MTIEFEDEAIRELAETGRSSDKRYRKLRSNAKFKNDFSYVLRILVSAQVVDELKAYKALNYERLKGDMVGVSSVRIGYTSKYRLIFSECDGGVKIKLIEVNEHYGDK